MPFKKWGEARYGVAAEATCTQCGVLSALVWNGLRVGRSPRRGETS